MTDNEKEFYNLLSELILKEEKKAKGNP